jgi:hypothetical protein
MLVSTSLVMSMTASLALSRGGLLGGLDVNDEKGTFQTSVDTVPSRAWRIDDGGGRIPPGGIASDSRSCGPVVRARRHEQACGNDRPK